MAKNTQLAYATCNAQANTIGGLCNDGYIRIYDGSQPANADTAITTQNLLATLRFASTAFGSPYTVTVPLIVVLWIAPASVAWNVMVGNTRVALVAADTDETFGTVTV